MVGDADSVGSSKQAMPERNMTATWRLNFDRWDYVPISHRQKSDGSDKNCAETARQCSVRVRHISGGANAAMMA